MQVAFAESLFYVSHYAKSLEGLRNVRTDVLAVRAKVCICSLFYEFQDSAAFLHVIPLNLVLPLNAPPKKKKGCVKSVPCSSGKLQLNNVTVTEN